MKTLFTFTVLLAALAGLSGCQNLGFQPWQRDLMAKPVMTPGAADGLDDALDDHIYFSKEASSGGRGFGGGGCGCN